MTALLERDDGPSPDRQSLEEGLNGVIHHLTFRIDHADAYLAQHGGQDDGEINDLHEYRRALQVIRASIWPGRYDPPHGRRTL